MPPFPDPDPDLTRLTDRARAAATQSIMAGDPTAALSAMEHRGQALLAMRSALHHELDVLAPPPELIAALRRPRGAPRLVRLAIHGRRARVVVHPTGVSSPSREAAVWQSLTMYVLDRRAP